MQPMSEPMRAAKNGQDRVDRAAAPATEGLAVVRLPPDMQVVTKGWWVLKEERRSVDELERMERRGF
jgi:hypothetical protein